jgi:hypothetical protein
MGNPVVHFEILGKDMEALNAFYSSIFDWNISPISDEYSLVETGSVEMPKGWAGITGGIGAMGPGREHVMFYVAVDDVAATLALIESKGGKLGFGPHPIPDGGIIGGFHDPEGHLVGLVQGPKKE